MTMPVHTLSARWLTCLLYTSFLCIVFFLLCHRSAMTTLQLPFFLKLHQISSYRHCTKMCIRDRYCITYLVAVLLILYAIYGILLILGRKVHLLCYCVYGLEFFYFTSYVIFQGHVSGYALPFTGLVMVVEFLVATYCEQSSRCV